MGFTSSASDMLLLPSIPPCIAYIADLEVIYGTHFFKTFLISLGHATMDPTMHYIADLDIGLKQFFSFKVSKFSSSAPDKCQPWWQCTLNNLMTCRML